MSRQSRAREPFRYRKIALTIHADEKYRRLTPAQPCGQVLWWHILAGEHTGIIPGLSCVGEATFAEQLGWTLKAFRQAFAEVQREGMVEVDWQARLMFVPNALRYNPPASPNVVKSWRDAWNLLPECALKATAWQRINDTLEEMGKPFAEAFAKACRKPFGKPFAKTWPNQEQDQEQDQEQECIPSHTTDAPTEPKDTKPDPLAGFGDFWAAYPRKASKTDAEKAWVKLKPDDALRTRILADVASRMGSRDWTDEGGRYVPYPATYLNTKRWEDDSSPPVVVNANDEDARMRRDDEARRRERQERERGAA